MSVANVVDSRVTTQLPARYQVSERLGAGASGETFVALDRTTNTACVIKLFADGSRGRRSALAEFRGLETLAHPSVVRLRDIGRLDDGRLYLVTDRVVGPGVEGIATIADEAERRTLFVRAAIESRLGAGAPPRARHRPWRRLPRQRAAVSIRRESIAGRPH